MYQLRMEVVKDGLHKIYKTELLWNLEYFIRLGQFFTYYKILIDYYK